MNHWLFIPNTSPQHNEPALQQVLHHWCLFERLWKLDSLSPRHQVETECQKASANWQLPFEPDGSGGMERMGGENLKGEVLNHL
jgi:hypothetical protein